jgi:bacillopeptidase F
MHLHSWNVVGPPGGGLSSCAAPLWERRVSVTQKKPAPVAEDVARAFDQREFVRYIVVLDAQADVEKTAAEALRAIAAKSPSVHRRLGARQAVVDALRATAGESQRDVAAICERETVTGKVKQYRAFHIINAVLVESDRAVMEEIAMLPEVKEVRPDERRSKVRPGEGPGDNGTTAYDWNIAAVRAPTVWDMWITGYGVVVASLDTGVDCNHPALSRQYRGAATGADVYSWYDAVNGAAAPYDDNGHGTHTTGTVLGQDPAEVSQIGVAPGAQWIAVKAFGSDGTGTDSDILAGAEWLLHPGPWPGDPAMAPDIINNSWGGGSGFDEWFRPAVQAWRAAGIIPVFATGNQGAVSGSISIPGCYPECIAVGAINSADALGSFSGCGPAPYPPPDNMKPDVVAPGVNITSAVPGGGYAGGSYWSGTSMAAPHVSGTIALMLQVNSGLTFDQIRQALRTNAEPLQDSQWPGWPNYGYGWGKLDAYMSVCAFLGNATVSGVVTSSVTHEPVADGMATVIETGATLPITDGNFEIELPQGYWGIEVSAPGFTPRRVWVLAVGGHSTTVNLELEPVKGTVSGYVRYAQSGGVMSGAKVSLVETGAWMYTDATGGYSLTADFGTYTLTAERYAYHTEVASVMLVEGSPTIHDFVMQPLVGYNEVLSYDDGTMESFVSLPTEGGMAAAGFHIDRPAWLDEVRFLFDPVHPDPGGDAIKWAIYDASGPHGEPGNVLAGPFAATARRDGAWTVIVALGLEVNLPTDFYLVYVQAADFPYCPVLGLDQTSTPTYKNWTNTSVPGQWLPLAPATGNIMIRAGVRYKLLKPEITAPENGLYTGAASLVVEGRTCPSCYVQVYLNGVVSAWAISGADGQFSANVPVNGDNDYEITVDAQRGGATSPQSEPVRVTVDTVPPTLTVASPPPDYVTHHNTIMLQAVMEDDRALDGLAVEIAHPSGSETIARNHLLQPQHEELSAGLLLAEGMNVITVVLYDQAGNSDTKVMRVVVDTVAPVLVNPRPATGTSLQVGEELNVGFDSESALNAAYVLNVPNPGGIAGGVMTFNALAEEPPGSGHYTGQWVVPAGFSVQNGEVLLTAVDQAGNLTQQVAPGRLTVPGGVGPAVGPTISLITAPGGHTTNGNDTLASAKAFTIKGQVIAGDCPVSAVTVNGTPASVLPGGFINHEIPLVEGMNSIVVRATDTEGKCDECAYGVWMDSYNCLLDVTAWVSGAVRHLYMSGHTGQKSSVRLQILRRSDRRVYATTNVTADACGEFKASAHSRIPSGRYLLTVRSVDTFGNVQYREYQIGLLATVYAT